MKTWANAVTLFRFFLIPMLIYTLVERHYLISALILAIAAASDLLDGYLARTYHQVTKWGMFLDPSVDKLMVISATTYFTAQGLLPMGYLLALFYRDFSLLTGLLALIWVGREGVVSARSFGKLSAGLTFSLLFFLSLERDYPFFSPLIFPLMWGSLVFVVISFVLYSYRWFQLYEGRVE